MTPPVPRKIRRGLPPGEEARKPRPAGWNAEVAAKRAALRIAKIHARNKRRGLSNRN